MTTKLSSEAIEVEKNQPEYTNRHVSTVGSSENIESRTKDAILNRETLVEEVCEFVDLTAQENQPEENHPEHIAAE